MMYRDKGIHDEFELICSVSNMTVDRFRMKSTLELENLKSGQSESLLVPIAGQTEVTLDSNGGRFELDLKDVCYLSKESAFSVRSRMPAELIWAKAPASKFYPSYVKRFSSLKPIDAGGPAYNRRVFTAIGESDPANRFIAGFVEGHAGNWTSFPPHRHDGKPEVYIYYGMGKKFGVQVVADEEEKAYVVRDGDSVSFEKGYHPNVAVPTVGMNFLWIISADPAARNLSVDIHPDFRDVPMGQTHLKTS